jgi:hypothetical protein
LKIIFCFDEIRGVSDNALTLIPSLQQRAEMAGGRMSGGDFSRMESPGQLNTPGSRTSSVLPDLLTQVSTRFLASFWQGKLSSMKEYLYETRVEFYDFRLPPVLALQTRDRRTKPLVTRYEFCFYRSLVFLSFLTVDTYNLLICLSIVKITELRGHKANNYCADL